MRILIAGGFGFVGGRLAVHLAHAGHQIILGSRKAYSQPDWLPQAEVEQIKWEDAAALGRSCSGVDVVIQAAGMNAQDCMADPATALAVNGVATARLVTAACRSNVQRFIYLSTAHVYADPLAGTITEETCPRNLHPYATSHLAGEHAVLSSNQRGTIQGIVLRLSNAFGAPTHKGVNCWVLLVNDLCRQAVVARKLVLKTSGLQKRDFVGLSEVCRVVSHLADGHDEYLKGGIFNVGTGISRSVFAMAQLIQERCIRVLGFEPALLRAETGLDEQHPMLSYQTEHLAALGIAPAGRDSSVEIDHLLRFCKSTFCSTESLRR